ncbi:MAG: helix-turn-helix domain-containing protein [Bacteroidota bacterium]
MKEKIYKEMTDCVRIIAETTYDKLTAQRVIDKRHVLRTMFDQQIAEIVTDTVCRYYRTEMRVIRSQTRLREVAIPRQIIAYLLCKLTGLTVTEIGKKIKRDHSTVIHSSRVAVPNMIETDKKMLHEIQHIEDLVMTFIKKLKP